MSISVQLFPMFSFTLVQRRLAASALVDSGSDPSAIAQLFAPRSGNFDGNVMTRSLLLDLPSELVARYIVPFLPPNEIYSLPLVCSEVRDMLSDYPDIITHLSCPGTFLNMLTNC
jgi:hypothetical protein